MLLRRGEPLEPRRCRRGGRLVVIVIVIVIERRVGVGQRKLGQRLGERERIRGRDRIRPWPGERLRRWGATRRVVTAVEGKQTDAICVLPQLPSTDGSHGSCAASSQAGWCYVSGADAGGCAQTLLTSPSGAVPPGAGAYLACGGTTAGETQAESAASVGVPCTPSPELSASFAGFNEREVTLDENNAACSGDVCLVNHFQGLTTCPYGQDKDGQPVAPQTACTVPGTGAPVRPNDGPSGQTVQPSCVDRRASDSVYCSCRCANAAGSTNDDAEYCTCPSGYACTQVVPEVQAGDPRAGAYCIPSGTAFDPNAVCASCDPTTNNCP
jgi:hypothetical protein